jgi:hypothetical protein
MVDRTDANWGRRAVARLARSLVAGVALALAMAPVVRAADEGVPVVVIVNKENLLPVDRYFVIRTYTGLTKGWPDGSPVFPLDQAENSPTRAGFYAQIVGRSAASMRAIWTQNIFSGKGLPPKIANADAEMKRLVSMNRDAIGYIRASEADGSVRVVPMPRP